MSSDMWWMQQSQKQQATGYDKILEDKWGPRPVKKESLRFLIYPVALALVVFSGGFLLGYFL